MSEPSYRELIDAPWMSGHLALVKREVDVVLVKKYYPFAIILWCLLLFGGLGYFLHRYVSLKFLLCWLSAGVLLSVFVAGLAVWMSKKPPILIAHYGGTIELPRYNCTFSQVSGICFGPVAYHRSHDVTEFGGGCLYARIAHSPDPVPLFIDDQRGDVCRVAKQLADALGVAFEILENQKV